MSGSLYYFVGDDYDPLCGLNRELRFISGNNILEELKLYLVVQDDAPCRTESKDWSAFDSVPTESGAFPKLTATSFLFAPLFLYHPKDVNGKKSYSLFITTF